MAVRLTGLTEWVSANWLTLVVGLIGVVATLGVYVLTQRLKRPSWAAHTVDLVTKKTAELRGLTVSFDGKSVSDLSVSRIVLFNDGSDPIRKQDIAPAAPLALEVPKDVTMLDASLVSVNNVVNRVTVNPDLANNRALVEFDFLAKNDGAVFDVVHYGGEQPTALVTGVVIGAPKLRHVTIAPPGTSPAFFSWFMGATSVVIVVYIVAQVAAKGLTWDIGLPAVFATIALLAFASSFSQQLSPKGLQAFDERRYRSKSGKK